MDKKPEHKKLRDLRWDIEDLLRGYDAFEVVDFTVRQPRPGKLPGDDIHISMHLRTDTPGAEVNYWPNTIPNPVISPSDGPRIPVLLTVAQWLLHKWASAVRRNAERRRITRLIRAYDPAKVGG